VEKPDLRECLGLCVMHDRTIINLIKRSAVTEGPRDAPSQKANLSIVVINSSWAIYM